MRLLFFGTGAFAVPSLEGVASRHAVMMCVTQPDRPGGRGLSLGPSPVKQAALRLGLALSQPPRLHAGLFEALRPEAGVAVDYGRLIHGELLDLPAHGMFGVHPSLLPAYRGAAPVAWALLNGDATTGVTVFKLSERLDAGGIVAARPVAIEPDEDAEALTRRLARLGAEELLLALDAVAEGRAIVVPQDDARASSAPKLTKAQGRIRWDAPAEAIVGLIRATVQWPGAATMWRGAPIKVWRAAVGTSRARGAAPGTIVQAGPDAVDVAAGQGTVAIRELQPAGRRRMSVKEFLAGHDLKVGDQLGTEA